MARYCSVCGRGSWACVCNVPFAEKLGTLQVSAGAKTNPINYFDSEAIRRDFGEEGTEEYIREDTHGVGTLRRDSKGDFYKKSWKTKEYEKATPKDIDNALLV